MAVSLPTWTAGKVGELVTLDGSASHDADGDPLTYRWAFVEPSTDSLDDETSARPRFLAQAASSQVVGLVVSDGTAESEADRSRVEVTSTSENVAPLADAGPDRNVRPGAPAELDGGVLYRPYRRAPGLAMRGRPRDLPVGARFECSARSR